MSASKGLLVAVAAAWLLGMNPAAQAQDYPDLKGTWKGTSETVLLGEYEHGPEESAQPRPHRVDFTLTLTNQDGRRVWGKIATKFGEEPWLAVIHSDGELILGVDQNGYVIGTIEGEDTLELCYLHADDDSVLEEDEGILAGCTVMRRQ
jgi:hypothetical protein